MPKKVQPQQAGAQAAADSQPSRRKGGRTRAERRAEEEAEDDADAAAKAKAPEEEEDLTRFFGVTYKVAEKADLGRLDAFLARRAAPITRSRVMRAIRDGGVAVNGAPVEKVSHKLGLGDEVEFVRDATREVEGSVEPENWQLRVVHEDSSLLVVNKDPGMAVHPAGGLRSGTLVNALLFHVGARALRAGDFEAAAGGDAEEAEDAEEARETKKADDNLERQMPVGLSACNAVQEGGRIVRPGIVHRLDRGTSGLLVVAKDDHAHQHLMRQFAERRTQRRYVALVWGCPEPLEGTVRATIARDKLDFTRMAVVPDCDGTAPARGKHAVTHYGVLRRLTHVSLVEFRLETGRTHQVRVHASYMGHPLVGDTLYWGAPVPRFGPQTAERNRRFRRLFDEVLDRPGLHAETLSFEHPYKGKRFDFKVPLHEDMQEAWSEIKSWPGEGEDSGWLREGAAIEGWE